MQNSQNICYSTTNKGIKSIYIKLYKYIKNRIIKKTIQKYTHNKRNSAKWDFIPVILPFISVKKVPKNKKRYKIIGIALPYKKCCQYGIKGYISYAKAHHIHLLGGYLVLSPRHFCRDIRYLFFG